MKGGIPPAAPPGLAPELLSLPPILYINDQDPTPGCSKAPRGLSVPPRVAGIFTGASSSPSPRSRQCPGRCSFHAGRNLPDKVLRYLRTVIVTAGLHRGFGSGLAPLPLTYRQWPGFSPYTSPYGLAGTCVFGKQSPGPILCGPQPQPRGSLATARAPLLPRLRGQFAEFLDRGYLAPLWVLPSPTCVGLRYGLRAHWLEAFLGR